MNIRSTEFKDDFATQSGHSLYGGLLDRCTITFKAQIYKAHFYDSHNKKAYPSGRTLLSGSSNFLNIINATIDSISSDPVRICFCKQEYLDCDYKLPSFYVKRGESSMCHLLLLIKSITHFQMPLSTVLLLTPKVAWGRDSCCKAQRKPALI